MTAQQITSLIKGLQDAIKEFNDAVKQGKDGSAKFEESISSVIKSANSFASATGASAAAMKEFSELSIKNSSSFGGLVSVIDTANDSLKGFKTAFDEIPLLGAAFSPVAEAATQLGEVFEATAKIAKNFAGMYDGLDKGTRDTTNTQYKYAASLGQTFEQAEKNTKVFQELIKANSELASKGIYFNGDDFKSGIAALQSAGISMSELSRGSGVSAGGLNNMQAMTMQARAMGMDIGEYSRKMGDMIRKTGLSTEDSMKMMAGAQSIASDTGLRLDEVTQSLEGAVGGFQKMGATLDFGRPVLRGFADSVKEIGLGVAQAGDLAAEFSKSLLGIVNNPALAYFTAMKGGLMSGTGGAGGVLNTSIQMEARMLDQSPGNQAKIAQEQSMAMREAIASTTGGKIITLNQAAESPELQTQFQTQREMLGSFYGISDKQTQSRVLEYLSNLEKATAEGDEDLIDKINDQIKDATNANDKTFDIQQKISQSIDKSLILMQEQINITKAKYGGEIEDAVMKQVTAITDLGNQLVLDPNNKALQDKQKVETASLDKMIGAMKKKEEKGATPVPGADKNFAGSAVANASTASNIAVDVNVKGSIEGAKGIIVARAGRTSAAVPSVAAETSQNFK